MKNGWEIYEHSSDLNRLIYISYAHKISLGAIEQAYLNQL